MGSKLLQKGIACEERQLPVGDFLWIARGCDDVEYVLPFIVERKRMDDLASSIIDNRYGEQKFRLKRCGVENVIYLVEGKMSGASRSQGVAALKTAMLMCKVKDGFMVQHTRHISASIDFLAHVHRD